jgi:hypothetical protein
VFGWGAQLGSARSLVVEHVNVLDQHIAQVGM